MEAGFEGIHAGDGFAGIGSRAPAALSGGLVVCLGWAAVLVGLGRLAPREGLNRRSGKASASGKGAASATAP